MRTRAIAIALLCLGAWLVPASGASAQAAPAWHLSVSPMPTHFAPGEEGEIFLVATNLGAAPTAGPIALTDILPVGLTPIEVESKNSDPSADTPDCEIALQVVTCTVEDPLGPSRMLEVNVTVSVEAASGTLSHETAISGGGAPEVKDTTPIPISATSPPFGFLAGAAGFGGPFVEDDGSASALAGSHSYQLSVNLGFPTEKVPGGSLEGAGHLRDVTVDLPRGAIVNPTATPVLCTEAQLLSVDGCPPASQVGLVTITTRVELIETTTSPVFNMVPPPGRAASLGFDALGVGVFVHPAGEVRSDGDFGLSGTVTDIPALPLHPAFATRLDLWGDPSSPVHDSLRGECGFTGKNCTKPVEPQETAFLTMPTECAGKPLIFKAFAKSWEEPETTKEASYESAELDGDPVSVSGCNALEFKPALEAQPTTDVADSPSGFNFKLHQPQDFDLDGLSTAALRDAVVTLPEGLVVNPSAAQGQEACSPTQIGMTSGVGQSPVRFSKDPDSCPDAAKIGRIEVKTPLLAEVDETGTVIQRDPEGNPIPRPLHGDVFLAEPFRNPFDSLLAIYFAVEDPKSGTVAKFATQIDADASTGQLRNVLTESPQLPLEDVRLEIFKGDRAPLRTPPNCATHTTATELIPWSAPEAPSASPSDSFAIANAPAGRPCPAGADGAPNTPAFSAGTITPQAGAFSPFVLKVSREDATQPLGGFEATLPPGLAAKLAGVPVCSEAQIAQAQARSNPNEGALEQADPSCSPATQLGSVAVAAGAGPTPLNVSGRIYLTGPYKGAPLSVAIVTPAVAGPFDLGAVVVRVALYLNPITAQVRAVSDPLPRILEGIPLDLRSATARMDRPQFTLNPTSCEPLSVNATATSVFGQPAALRSPFQVGGCEALPFAPKLALRLLGGTKRGGHPRLQATLTGRAGDANIARATISLPRSQFVDQAHIRTVCTRVQFAADQCPKGAIYGHVKASTPLLDEVLEGPVYLRSSDNELPDAVGVLKGPPSRPIEVEGVARIDSVKGRGVRINIDTVPDVAIGKVVVMMQGGAKGLLINSRNLCARAYRANVKMRGQNGKVFDSRPALKNDCKKKRRGKKGKRR